MAIRAVMFDKDGTFVDFNATWGRAIEAAMRTLAGADAAAFGRLCVVNHFDPTRQQLLPTSPFIAEASADFARRWAEALDVPMSAAFNQRLDELLDQHALTNVVPVGRPAEVFAALRQRGLRVAVVTNDTERGARLQCAKLNLDGLVDAIVGYDSGHGRKPEPGQLLAVAAAFGLAPGEVAMVGDTLHDMRAARAAGSLAIGVLSGFSLRHELAPFADHVIGDISDLSRLLDQSSV